jgi:hypothetical protein
VRVTTDTDLVLDELETDTDTGAETDTESEGKGGLCDVEKIITHKMIRGVQCYRIKWEGYPSSANTWEPIDNLKTCRDLVEEYHREEECRRKARKRRRLRR